MPTACGIETVKIGLHLSSNAIVATVPTACGIETNDVAQASMEAFSGCNSAYRLRY